MLCDHARDAVENAPTVGLHHLCAVMSDHCIVACDVPDT